jgi:hypothetical protein
MRITANELCDWCLTSGALLRSENKHIEVPFKPFGRGRIVKITGQVVHIRISEPRNRERLMALSHFKAYFDRLISPRHLQELRDQYAREKNSEERERREKKKREEQESQRRNELFRPLEAFMALANQALRNSINAEVSAPSLRDEDVHLAVHWSQSTALKQAINSRKDCLRTDYAQHWELACVLSARAAEKATIDFYQKHGFTVQDVAITQIAVGRNDDWRDYDLKINGFPLDVKNSRRSKPNKANYVEHCVPRFKRNRDNLDVTVAGLLSSFLWPHQLTNPKNAPDSKDSSILFLGTTSFEKQLSIKKTFEVPGLLEIVLTRPGRGSSHFLPPWLFDYPDFLYKQRDDALLELAKLPMPEYSLFREFDSNPIPVLIAGGIELQDDWYDGSLPRWQRLFISKILAWRKNRKLSLPFLFLTILKHFLEMISDPTDLEEGYNPKKYRELIYYPYYDHQYCDRPLFIYDPLRTIDSLITSLITLFNAQHELISSFTLFRLQNLNILRGRFDKSDKQWKTLIAYCGGRMLNKAVCDKNPLVLGMADNCPECGKLVCTDCGFCDKYCSLCESHQLDVQLGDT